MNYYEHHLGDYSKDAGHLSMIEHGAYRLLLDAYYTREGPLPTDRKACHRLARATSKVERDVVDTVLEEFFVLSDDGWRHTRCDKEIAKYEEKKPGAAEKRENDKERQRRARERRKQMFEVLSSHGINMPWNATTDQLHAEMSRVTNRDESQPVTQPVTRDNTATRHQTPDTSPQTPDLKAKSKPLPAKPAKFDPASIPIPDGLNLTKWGEWIAYRRGRRLTTAEPTMRKQLEFLTQCQARGQPADAVIEASIANGWQGLFELKGSGNGKNGSSRAERVSATIAELTGANRDPSRVIDGTAARVD